MWECGKNVLFLVIWIVGPQVQGLYWGLRGSGHKGESFAQCWVWVVVRFILERFILPNILLMLMDVGWTGEEFSERIWAVPRRRGASDGLV